MNRPALAAALSKASTADLAWLLGEILEPSRDGPFGKSYREDAEYEGFMDAVWPVTREYQQAYDAIERSLVDQMLKERIRSLVGADVERMRA